MNELRHETEVAEVLLNLAPKIIEQLHEGIIIVDRDLNIQFSNASAEWMFDRHRSQMIGQNINLLLPERFHERHTQHTRRYVGTPSPRPMGRGVALSGITSTGKEFPVEISLTPFKTTLGTFIVAVVHAKEASSPDASP